jgi:hypothetical protein
MASEARAHLGLFREVLAHWHGHGVDESTLILLQRSDAHPADHTRERAR